MPSPYWSEALRRRFAPWRHRFRLGRRAVAAVPLLWLGLFFGLPFLLVLRISLAETVIGLPPYSALVEWIEGGILSIRLNFANFALLWQDSLYLDAFISSVRIAATATLGCLVLGYPMALGIARVRTSLRIPLLLLVILPFWTSFLIRVYAWIGILKSNGLANNLLLWLGWIDQPLALLHTEFAVLLGIVYGYLPFMVLPLYATLSRMDESLLEAAALDLGARPWKVFFVITLPLIAPALAAGWLLAFTLSLDDLVIASFVSGPGASTLPMVVYSSVRLGVSPEINALATVLVVLVTTGIVIAGWLLHRREARQHLAQ